MWTDGAMWTDGVLGRGHEDGVRETRLGVLEKTPDLALSALSRKMMLGLQGLGKNRRRE